MRAVKRPMFDRVREVCVSVRGGGEGKNLKIVWWNGVGKATVEASWKEVSGGKNEAGKERCMDVYKEERKNVMRCILSEKDAGK